MDILLDDLLFEKISNGTKTVEIFLNDEEMKHFSVGDTLAVHRKSDKEDMILASAWSIKKFKKLAEIYKLYSEETVGLSLDELTQVYPQNVVKKHGVLAVKMRVLKANYD
ncbi:ASCH domain-containing protein [Liquorilactobacillus uvarum]|uniref:ASCH domain-containing protein n=1 Tax=Liquorilactobacillus uvarum TaxID=303240 RepID=UPI002889BED8|nr:ASCH domain-containing protein [Liquorilactobacillus uvarum]